MRAKDNGDKLVCANNLLATIRGEVAYDRLRGLEARNFDLPYGVAETEIQQDAAWVLGIYERLIEAVSSLRRPTRRALAFLSLCALGGVAGMLLPCGRDPMKTQVGKSIHKLGVAVDHAVDSIVSEMR